MIINYEMLNQNILLKDNDKKLLFVRRKITGGM